MVGDLPAGHAPTVPVRAGQAIRIMTGAPIPEGADAIVPVERTARVGEAAVDVFAEAAPGDHIRAAGGDIETGGLVFEPGAVLTPAHIGVLASLGWAEVEVFPQARVGVLSTGDELREGPGPLEPGQIRDSNRPMLLALVREAGCEAVNLGKARDDEAQVTRVLEEALESCDAVISSGGVSVGDYDVVKAVLDQMGMLQWSQVAIKPAKPLAFGVLRGTPLFGLPGNPVSSHVSFELFARPALRKMMGHTVLDRPVVDAVAAAPMRRNADGKVYFDRVRVWYERRSLPRGAVRRAGQQRARGDGGRERPGRAARRPGRGRRRRDQGRAARPLMSAPTGSSFDRVRVTARPSRLPPGAGAPGGRPPGTRPPHAISVAGRRHRQWFDFRWLARVLLVRSGGVAVALVGEEVGRDAAEQQAGTGQHEHCARARGVRHRHRRSCREGDPLG